MTIAIVAQGDPTGGYENCASLVEPADLAPGNDKACFTPYPPLTVTPETSLRFGCDRKGAYVDGVTLHIEGGVGPFECQGPDGQPPRMDDPRTCAFTAPAGTFDYTVTDNGTQRSQTVSATLPEVLGIDAQVTNATSPGCRNGAISATVSGGLPPYTYRLTPAGLDHPDHGSHVDFSSLRRGTYTLTFTDDQGCRNSKTFTLSCNCAAADGNRFYGRLHYGQDQVDELDTGSVDRFTFADLNGNGVYDLGEPYVSGGSEAPAPRLTDLELQTLSAELEWRPTPLHLADLCLQPRASTELGAARIRVDRRIETGSTGGDEGGGSFWGLGVGLDLHLCPSCPWSLGGAYSLTDVSSLELDGLRRRHPSGTAVVSTGTIDLRRRRAEATLAYAALGGRGTFRLGLRRTWYETRLRSRTAVGGKVSITASDHDTTLDAVVAEALLRRGRHGSIQATAGIGSSGWSLDLTLGLGFGGRSSRSRPAPVTGVNRSAPSGNF